MIDFWIKREKIFINFSVSDPIEAPLESKFDNWKSSHEPKCKAFSIFDRLINQF